MSKRKQRGRLKARFDLVPGRALQRVALVMASGDAKHKDDPWSRQPPSVHFSAAQRHLWNYFTGQDPDGEGAVGQLARAACRTLFLLAKEIARDEALSSSSSGKEQR